MPRRVVESFSTTYRHLQQVPSNNERGTRVGPDLTRIGHGITRERLLESILQPNKEVSPYMRPWAIRTQDGKNHMGIAMRRGGNSEAYLGIDGKEFHINKLTIVIKQELHTSMMPRIGPYPDSIRTARSPGLPDKTITPDLAFCPVLATLGA